MGTTEKLVAVAVFEWQGRAKCVNDRARDAIEDLKRRRYGARESGRDVINKGSEGRDGKRRQRFLSQKNAHTHVEAGIAAHTDCEYGQRGSTRDRSNGLDSRRVWRKCV